VLGNIILETKCRMKYFSRIFSRIEIFDFKFFVARTICEAMSNADRFFNVMVFVFIFSRKL